MYIRKIRLGVLFVLTVLSSSLSASESEGTSSSAWDQIDPAWSQVSSKIVDFVGEENQKLLADLAYAAVASDMCENLKLDRKKFQTEFDDKLGTIDSKSMTGAELTQYGEKVSMYFGVYVGMLTSIGMLERNAFCQAAQEMKAGGDGRFWL